MSLAERLAEPSTLGGGRACSLCELTPTLPKKERDALNTALARDAKAGGWSARVIADSLAAEGYPHIKRSTVEHHRREHMS